MLVSQRAAKLFSSAKDTCLKQLHLDNQGKIVDFAGKCSLIKDTTCLFSMQEKVSSRNIFTVGKAHQFLMSVTWGRSSSLGQIA